MQHRYLLMILPTGFSKSTFFSFAYPLWRLWREKGIEICLTSSSLEQGMKLFRSPQDELETNPFFSSLLPKNRFSSWNKSYLETSNGNQFYIKPFNTTARGIHPNFIIYDDLLRDNDTPMETIKETFWSVYFPRGQIHKCQHIMVGTPLSPTDLYADIEKDNQWTTIRMSAVIEDEAGRWKESLWPERWSLENLGKIRDGMTDFRFVREYQCHPKATGDTLFPQDMILDCLDDDLEYNYTSQGVTSQGCDFAMSTKSSGDYNVFTVADDMAGQKHTKNVNGKKIEVENPVLLKRIIRFRGNTGHIESIKSLESYFPQSKIIADESGVGAKFVQELRENQLMVQGQDFAPASRNLLLMNLRRLLEQGRLVIPNKGESVPLTNRLIKELSGFVSVRTRSGRDSWQSNVDHDDMVMSLALAVKGIGSPRKVLKNLFYGVRA